MSERRRVIWGTADVPQGSDQVRAALQAAAARSPVGAWLPDVDGAVTLGRRRRTRRTTGAMSVAAGVVGVVLLTGVLSQGTFASPAPAVGPVIATPTDQATASQDRSGDGLPVSTLCAPSGDGLDLEGEQVRQLLEATPGTPPLAAMLRGAAVETGLQVPEGPSGLDFSRRVDTTTPGCEPRYEVGIRTGSDTGDRQWDLVLTVQTRAARGGICVQGDCTQAPVDGGRVLFFETRVPEDDFVVLAPAVAQPTDMLVTLRTAHPPGGGGVRPTWGQLEQVLLAEDWTAAAIDLERRLRGAGLPLPGDGFPAR